MKKNKKKFIFFGFIILTILISLSLTLLLKIDSDYLWHIRAGEYMFKNGILKKDVFSWFLFNKYWMSHEWLFEVFLYFLKLIFGNFHIYIYSFFSILTLLFILIFSNKKNYFKNIPFTFLWYLMFFLIIIVFIQARPHLLSFSFLALTVYCLYDTLNNENSKKIYILPVLSILWANFHGGSSNLSYIFCLIFIIAGSFKFESSKVVAERLSKKQYFKYFFLMILCMVAVCINVHGFKMFIYPYTNMLDKTMISNISEWRITSLNEGYHYIFYIFLIINIFIMLFSKKKIKFMDLILLGVAAYLGLKSIRFWMYSFIIINFIIFSYIEKRKIDKGTISSIFIIIICLSLFFVLNFKGMFNVKFQAYLNKDIVDIIKKENPERLFNMYDYGGDLIYNDIKVFIDGRADLYSKYNYKDYLNISLLQTDYIKLINKYNFDYFLVNKNYPINTYLKYNDNYKIIYKNKELIFYKNKKSS